MKVGIWKKDEWPFSTDPMVISQFACYSITIGRGILYLRVMKSDLCKYQYTSHFGANSDNSFSGCLPNEFNKLTLKEAQAAVLFDAKKHIY